LSEVRPRLVAERSLFRAEALQAQSSGEVGEPGLALTNRLFLCAGLMIALLALLAAGALSRSIVAQGAPDCSAAEAKGARATPPAKTAGPDCAAKSHRLQPVSDTLARLRG
jgi:hypothetical protein